MKTASEKLITELITLTMQHINFATDLQKKSDKELNHRTSENSWSILECIQHLNLYGRYYLPEIENKIKASNTKGNPVFSSGILGNYFAKNMLPKEQLNKMSTFKNMNPIHSKLDRNVSIEFINQQHKFLELLDKSRNVDMGKVKISISISKLIKLKLGDTFRFVIYHNLRHIKQAERVLQSVGVNY